MFWKLLLKLIIRASIVKKNRLNIKIIYSNSLDESILNLDKYIKFIKHLINVFNEQEQRQI